MFHSAKRPTRNTFRRLTLAAAIVAAMSASGVMAQSGSYADVNRLLKAGQLNEALAKADEHLAGKPSDPQMRFLRGVIQTEAGKTSDAIATFLKLTEDYPELPEPYNNLAVLYAGQSQFDKARAALEMAIRTNPSYATAHENLGDVYAKLASQAYSKALQIDANNSGVGPKLSLIRGLFAGNAAAVQGTQVAAAPAAPAAAPAPAAASPAPATETATTEPGAADAETNINSAVLAWAKAWSTKDMKGYLSAYAPNFTPQGGMSRQAWEKQRHSRIVPRQSIEVDVTNLSVDVRGNRATASFDQAYKSDHLSVDSRKTLEMVKSGNRWLIVSEQSGS
ncbi:tetratricopeptide repeat protein [Hydrogenophaga sp. 5NK40-0174]|uniref:nuclear transport factor 2 family protein n=1 Tax=Hydrogenophaga sp. 5NK40-0174 TaxID=3127649 RepID=UPI00310889BA